MNFPHLYAPTSEPARLPGNERREGGERGAVSQPRGNHRAYWRSGGRARWRHGNLNREGAPNAAGTQSGWRPREASSGAGPWEGRHLHPGLNSRRPSGGRSKLHISSRENLPLKKHALPRYSYCQLHVRGAVPTSLLVKGRLPHPPRPEMAR